MRPATFVIKQIAETVGTLLQQRAARKFVLKQPTNLSTLLPCIVTVIVLALISEKGILIAAPASDVSHAFRERRSVYIRDIKPVRERARCGTTRSQSLSQSTDLRYKATIMVPSIPNQCCEKLSLFLDGGPNLSV